MANYLAYNNVQVFKGNTLVTTISKVKVAVSTKATAAYNKYKNYSQSNIFQVGTWTTGGTAGTTVMQFNENWNIVCSDFGIKPSVLTMLLYSQTYSPPTTAQKTDFLDNMRYYFPDVVDCLNIGDIPNIKYNNANYGLYAMFEGSVSNFRRLGLIPVYDPIENHWYTIEFQYRTDNFNPGKVWLTVGNAPQVQSTFFPASGVPIVNTANPYPNIPDSGTSGGDGSGTDTSDNNPVPLLPSVSAIGTGMCRLYNPTVAQLIDLGAWLWGSGLDLTQLKKIFSDPMDVILGCSVFPVSMPTETTPQTIIFGNIDSQISSRVVSSQYTSYDLGQIDVTSYYNSYLDFAPYTKMQIYLPFIGMKSLNVDEFMSTADVAKRIGVTYSIDLLSGACVAHIYLNVGSTSTLLYEFGGTCNTQIPLNSRDYTATVQSLLGIVGGSVAAGVAAFMLPETIPAVVGAAGAVGGMFMNAAKNTIASKPTVEHAGGIGGSTGIMGSRKAYLIIERPNLCHPENQEHFTGYPGFLYRTVNQLNGYTKFINFELQNIHATEPELEEIKEWFTVKGVLL